MPALNACDLAYPPTDIEAFYQRLKAAGILVVHRYLYNGTKGVTAREIAAAEAVGIWLDFGYEGARSNWRGGFAQGKIDAAAANEIADSLGVPDNRLIHYAIDEDAQFLGMLPTALAYIQGADTGKRPAAPYGGFPEIDYIKRSGSFQTYAWSGGRVSDYTALYQWRNEQPLAGANVDYDALLDGSALGIPSPALSFLEELVALDPNSPAYKQAVSDIASACQARVQISLENMLRLLGGPGNSGQSCGDFDPNQFDTLAGLFYRLATHVAPKAAAK